MKLELTEGCICDSFTADGRPVSELDINELKSIFKAVVTKIVTSPNNDEETKYMIESALYDLVSRFYDEYESDDEPCECCGDFVETFKMEVFL